VPNYDCWLSGHVVWFGIIFAFREPVAGHVTLAAEKRNGPARVVSETDEPVFGREPWPDVEVVTESHSAALLRRYPIPRAVRPP
jgi:hypothetical protein